MISVTKNMGDLRTEDVCGCAATVESQYAPLRNNVFVSFLYQPAGITRLWCCILLAYNVHQGNLRGTLVRFLKAREWSVPKAHKMLMDCLNWRVQNEIDSVLAKPILPSDLYRAIRDTLLVGLTGYSKQVNYYVQSHIQMNEYRDRVVLPAASKKFGRQINTCLKVMDMTGLKLSALSQIKMLTMITTVDDLNYPEKTETYYIVNAPYVFSACWKVVKPLLQERTKKKIQVLYASGRDELLKVMDSESLPHFCKREGSGSSRDSLDGVDCYSYDHPFHQQLYNYMKQQSLNQYSAGPRKQGSVHVDVPSPGLEEVKIAETIKAELQNLRGSNGLTHSFNSIQIEGP
ncbi:SEC14 cytosolic factor isoform X3 [Sorghum bicolor]|uniref:SEC14 cytosolic factor isoform X3 n=1 Tax=Sorghum bicolor TaxID=4558 RepID=UPI000B423CF7|nr:SEC14 cytosolic factor isoform X3 [Sorghum bicolor]|eukprot:XP_021310403.1 SEC14 cytosolic factor isoform X3 [Sorghum bicolor]